MTRYSWMIHTAQDDAEGAVGDVYLALHGLMASTRELKLPRRDYAGGTVESGIIEVRTDLGELQTGSLRTDAAERSVWTPDWLRIVNLSDGRQWSAQGAACDPDGACPLLQFVKTRDPIAGRSSEEEDGESQDDRASGPAGNRPSQDKSGEAEPTQDVGSVVRTYEIFGTQQGRLVPLSAILRVRDGRKQLTLGAQVFVTDQASQGFGLAGEPGWWADLYPGEDPARYGLDSDKPVLASDGVRGWVVDAHYLALIFGAEWRRVVYGN